MTLNPPPVSSAIPILDWNGPEFLLFYAPLLGGALAWSWFRIQRQTKRFETGTSSHDLTDPFEIAYLAGGSPRVIQLAVARLLKLRLASWERGWLRDRIVGQGKIPPAGLHPIEATLLDVISRKRKGVFATDVMKLCGEPLGSIQSRVAAAGLRPTHGEVAKAANFAILPVIPLLALGGIKLAIGWFRDKPVGFLIVLIFLTLAILGVIRTRFQRSARTTVAGDAMLERIRLQQTQAVRACDWQPDLALWSLGVAMSGPFAMTGIWDAQEIAMRMNQQLNLSGGSSGGGGCGSGCGGDGGGCGGCGGGD